MIPLIIGVAGLAAFLVDCATSSNAERRHATQKREEPHWKNETTFTMQGPCLPDAGAADAVAYSNAQVKAVNWWLKKTPEGKICDQSTVKQSKTKTTEETSVEGPTVRAFRLDVRGIDMAECSDENGLEHSYKVTVEVNLKGAEFMCVER